MQLTEEVPELIVQAQGGSHEAFAELVRTHQQTVRSFLSRFLRGSEAADDLAQEVFLVAFRRLKEYRGDAPLQHWLLGIARNHALTYIRGEVRRRRREKKAFESAMLQWQADSLGDDQDTTHLEEDLAALRDCITKLPPNSRQVLDSFYFQEQSTESIARQQNKKSGAIRMMLLRIRQALAKCIGAKNLGRAEQ